MKVKQRATTVFGFDIRFYPVDPVKDFLHAYNGVRSWEISFWREKYKFKGFLTG